MRTLKMIFVFVATLLCAPAAVAQKYKTDIPPGISIPDTVETRLGTLRFKDGFPDDATVQKVYDNLDFQRGVEAVSHGHAGCVAGRPAHGASCIRS